jgi:hypothetical protein
MNQGLNTERIIYLPLSSCLQYGPLVGHPSGVRTLIQFIDNPISTSPPSSKKRREKKMSSRSVIAVVIGVNKVLGSQ